MQILLLFMTGNFINNGLVSVAPTRCQSVFHTLQDFLKNKLERHKVS